MNYANIDMRSAQMTSNQPEPVEAAHFEIDVLRDWWRLMRALLVARVKGRRYLKIVVWATPDRIIFRRASKPQPEATDADQA
jgi:hypothetical protein